MKFSVQITAQAETDLREIFEYIAFDLQAAESAKGQRERLESSILGLEHMPGRFHGFEAEPWRSRGLRVMPVDNYCVFYIPDKTQGVVTILRIMYGGRDIESQLSKLTDQ